MEKMTKKKLLNKFLKIIKSNKNKEMLEGVEQKMKKKYRKIQLGKIL
jgi:hypothetical protein